VTGKGSAAIEKISTEFVQNKQPIKRQNKNKIPHANDVSRVAGARSAKILQPCVREPDAGVQPLPDDEGEVFP
jgi:hypothetical protein